MVIQILAAIATEGQSVVIQETLNAWKGMSSADESINCAFNFSQQCSSSNAGPNVPSNAVTDRAAKFPWHCMGAFYFTASHHEVRFLLFGWSSTSTRIYKDT